MSRRGFRIVMRILFFGCQLFVEIGAGAGVIMVLWAVFGRNIPPSSIFDYIAYTAVAIAVFFAVVYSWHTTFRKRRRYYGRRL